MDWPDVPVATIGGIVPDPSNERQLDRAAVVQIHSCHVKLAQMT